MNNFFYKQIQKARKDILSNPRKCEICGCIETLDNVILKYDNGLIMCDECMLDYYKDDPI